LAAGLLNMDLYGVGAAGAVACGDGAFSAAVDFVPPLSSSSPPPPKKDPKEGSVMELASGICRGSRLMVRLMFLGLFETSMSEQACATNSNTPYQNNA
jgi:hypothetical protein